MKQPPDKIYLQWHGDGEPDDVGEVDESEVTWCKNKIFEHDIEYVPASRIAELEAAIEKHKAHTDAVGFMLVHDELLYAELKDGK